MSTMHRTIGRYLGPVLAVAVLPLLVAGAHAATSNSSSKTTLRSAAPAKRTSKPAPVPKSPITISLNHKLRQGSLIVLLNDRPIFNEEFQKPALVISQTTTWDPVEAPAGKHKLTAQVNGKNGKTYFSRTYELELPKSSKGMEIRFLLKGDKLTIAPAS